MPEISTTHLGGTMRLGLRPTIFQKGTETWSKIRKHYDKFFKNTYIPRRVS
jgi:CTP synthase